MLVLMHSLESAANASHAYLCRLHDTDPVGAFGAQVTPALGTRHE